MPTGSIAAGRRAYAVLGGEGATGVEVKPALWSATSDEGIMFVVLAPSPCPDGQIDLDLEALPGVESRAPANGERALGNIRARKCATGRGGRGGTASHGPQAEFIKANKPKPQKANAKRAACDRPKHRPAER
jgi:hypothetical protein